MAQVTPPVSQHLPQQVVRSLSGSQPRRLDWVEVALLRGKIGAYDEQPGRSMRKRDHAPGAFPSRDGVAEAADLKMQTA